MPFGQRHALLAGAIGGRRSSERGYGLECVADRCYLLPSCRDLMPDRFVRRAACHSRLAGDAGTASLSTSRYWRPIFAEVADQAEPGRVGPVPDSQQPLVETGDRDLAGRTVSHPAFPTDIAQYWLLYRAEFSKGMMQPAMGY
jgi:hypothetical protein